MEREQRIGSMPGSVTPLEKADAFGNGEKGVQGFEKTLLFLQEAIAEEANLKIPIIQYGPHYKVIRKIPEEQWARQKNIIDVYFRSPATLEDIGKMYKITRQGVSQIIKRGLNNLWRNCSLETQAKFPFEELILKKPISQRSRDRNSMVKSGITVKIREGLEQGKSIQEIEKENTLTRVQINSARSRLKKSDIEVPYLTTRTAPDKNKKFEQELKEAKTDKETQELLNKASKNFVATRLRGKEPLFLSVSKVIMDAGFNRGFQRRNFGAFLVSLKNSGFPVGETPHISKKTGISFGGSYHVILAKDVERAKQILLEDPNLQKFKRS